MTIGIPETSGAASANGRLATGALLCLICGTAAVLRFTGLGWGAPYFHFHIDEHFVFAGADLLRQSVRKAAMSDKFFMYGPLPMWILNALVAVYSKLVHPLALTINQDEVTYMMLGRAISATFGTACVPLAYVVARRVAGRVAGLIAALLLACAVVHLRESHFFSVDMSMIFFSLLAWVFALRMADTGRWREYVFAGLSLGGAIASKYSGAFVVGVLLVAHLCAPGRPRRLSDVRAWALWTARGVTPLVVAFLVFAAVDFMAFTYFEKFRSDVQQWVLAPAAGSWRPIYIAQFADVQPQLYWFTNLLWWGLGPAFEVAGLLGVVWLLVRHDQRAIVAASWPIAYWVAAGQTIAPHMRYAAPLAVGLAVTAGVLCADLLRPPRGRVMAAVATVVVCATTALYAAAYMNVFLAPDSRLTAANWLKDNVPAGAKILVEPHHNIPPMGSYLAKVNFYGDYVLWRNATRYDYYDLTSLDVYDKLYNRRTTDETRREEIQSHLAAVDWIVMDDTFRQFYEHLPERDHGVVKQHYRDLFAGRLGFQLVRTFKVYPSLFGHDIVDDDAELSGRLFDHPTIYVFARRSATSLSQ